MDHLKTEQCLFALILCPLFYTVNLGEPWWVILTMHPGVEVQLIQDGKIGSAMSTTVLSTVVPPGKTVLEVENKVRRRESRDKWQTSVNLRLDDLARSRLKAQCSCEKLWGHSSSACSRRVPRLELSRFERFDSALKPGWKEALYPFQGEERGLAGGDFHFISVICVFQ